MVAGSPLMHDTVRRFMEPKLAGTGQMSDGARGGRHGCGAGTVQLQLNARSINARDCSAYNR